MIGTTGGSSNDRGAIVDKFIVGGKNFRSTLAMRGSAMDGRGCQAHEKEQDKALHYLFSNKIISFRSAEMLPPFLANILTV